MSLIAKNKAGSNIPPIEAGTYVGVCVGVVDIGEQKNDIFNNYSHKVVIIYELGTERVEIDGQDKPRWLSETYTVSLSDKANLYKTLLSWRGRDFTDEELDGGLDLAEMVGKPCQVQVLVVDKKDGTKCNRIAGVFGLPKGMEAPKPENPTLVYNIEDGESEVFLQLPSWMQDKIRHSTEWAATHNGTDKVSFDDELPKTVEPESKPDMLSPDEIPF